MQGRVSQCPVGESQSCAFVKIPPNPTLFYGLSVLRVVTCICFRLQGLGWCACPAWAPVLLVVCRVVLHLHACENCRKIACVVSALAHSHSVNLHFFFILGFLIAVCRVFAAVCSVFFSHGPLSADGIFSVLLYFGF